jgi:glutamate/tyrosine decarboxylase-like PLP-dependent enzyme
MTRYEPLDEVDRYAREFLAGLPDRPVRSSAGVDELRALLDHELPEDGLDARSVIAELIKGADPGIMASTSPRFFGFVIGGHSEVALAADWLTSLWDQNAGLFVAGPSASVVEEVAARWLRDLLNIPHRSSVAFVTGTQMAHFTCLAAARHHVLAAEGWDVEERGLQGSPPINVIASEEFHVTVGRALRFLGLGSDSITVIPCDAQGRARAEPMVAAIEAAEGPSIVCLQAGNVNSGAFDPIPAVVDAAHAKGAWVHLDGAFGLWAAASPELAHLLDGSERVDSWSTDAHKWLNVPYDGAMAFCAHPESHNAAIGVHASYLIHSEGHRERDQMDWTPEFSRRARGFTVYAQLRALGRVGVRDVIERCCALARRFADRLGTADGVEIVNDVVLNQVLVRFTSPDGDHDGFTKRVVERVQQDGTLWLSGSIWQGRHVMRISVSNIHTTEADVDASVEAILAAASVG